VTSLPASQQHALTIEKTLAAIHPRPGHPFQPTSSRATSAVSPRCLTGEPHVAISSAYPAGEAAWKAAGQPPLFSAYEFSNKPVTSVHHLSFYWVPVAPS